MFYFKFFIETKELVAYIIYLLATESLYPYKGGNS
jgi:hypothetical protein